MLHKTKEKLCKDAKMLLENCDVKGKRTWTEGQEECEGQEALEHFEKAVDFIEVGRDAARVVSERGHDVTESEGEKVVIDKTVVEEENVKQFREMQAIGEPLHLSRLRVNLAGRSAKKLPGQSQKNLWERHSTERVDQQRKVISGMEQVEMEVLGVWLREAVRNLHELYLYRKYRQVLKDTLDVEEVLARVLRNKPEVFPPTENDAEDEASLGYVMESVQYMYEVLQEIERMKDFSPCAAFSSTRRDPGLYHAVCTAEVWEHMLCHDGKTMAASLFLG